MSDTTQLRAGRALGSRYELLELLGSGAMGAVWSAIDRETGETTAAKVLHTQYSNDVGVVTRFVQERSILLELRHRNIVQVRDLVVEGANLAIVMDLVQGTDLRRHLQAAGTVAPSEAAELMADVMDALAVAHGKGVVHRDVKPDNILLDTTGDTALAKLSDFGVARLAQESQVRMSGLLGTADYMAPETFLANEVGAASDIYAAGITLYELLAGRTPFAGENAAANAFVVARHHASSAPPSITGLPSQLVSVLDSMLAKDPRSRPSAVAVAANLRKVLPGLAGLAAVAPIPAPTEWTPVEGTPSYEPGGMAAPIAGDPNATMIGVPAPQAATMPVAGAAPAFVSAEADGSVTQLGGKLPSRSALDLPSIAPAAATAPKERNQKVLWIIGGVVTAAALGGLAVVLPGGGGSNSNTASDSQAPPIVGEPETNAAAQIEIDHQITIANGQATVQVTWKNNSTRTLKNATFYEGAVGFGGSTTACPANSVFLTGSGVTAPVDATNCGWDVTVAAIPGNGGTVTATYALNMPSESAGQLQTDVHNTLRGINTATTAVLTGLTGSWQYPLQRYNGLSVVVGIAKTGQTIPMQVRPLWNGDTSDSSQTIYDSTVPYTGNAISTALGQPLTLQVSGCSSQMLSTGGGRVGIPHAGAAGETCTVTAQLGGYTSEPTQFQVVL